MKKNTLLIFFAFFHFQHLLAQNSVPLKFNYQAVVRNADGTFKEAAALPVIITLEDNAGKRYVENHTVSTNRFGLFTAVIGGGIVSSGRMEELNWAGGEVFITVSVEGTSLGKAQLLSVPYAVMANRAISGSNAGNYTGRNGIEVDNVNNVISTTIDTNRFLKIGDLGNTTVKEGQTLLFENGKWTFVQMNNGTQSALNGVSKANQKLEADSSGSDFNIRSDTASATHTFNIPTIGSLNTKRGLLSAKDYNHFRKSITTPSGIKPGQTLVYDGTEWDTLTPGVGIAGKFWSLEGNSIKSSSSVFIGTTDNTGLKLTTAGQTRMLIDSTGNFHFGPSAPGPRGKFEFNGAVGNTSAIFTSGSLSGMSLISGARPGIGFNQYFGTTASYTIADGTSSFISLDPAAGKMYFGMTSSALSGTTPSTNSTPLVISNTISVGIKNTSPQRLLTVGSLPADSNSIFLPGYSGGNNQLLYVDNNGIVRDTAFAAVSVSLPSGAAHQTLRYDPVTSNWTPSSMITNAGTSVIIGTAGQSGTVLTVNGKMRTDNITESSDIRLKTDICKLENSLEKISRLQGVSYYWKKDTLRSKRDIGLIAQEIEIVFPELVDTDEKGFKSVRYSHLVPLLLEALKEQSQLIAKLQKQLIDENNKTTGLQKDIEILQASVKVMNEQISMLLELSGRNEGLKTSR